MTSATVSSNSLIGKVIFGRYQLERKVGQGGMAWVFRARDLENDEIVAAKILLPHIAESPELRERFLREARIQAQLEHPHVVQLYDANEEDHISAIILEWIEGETMLDVSKRVPKPMGAGELYRMFAPILDALTYAHDQQMVHRDIKLENIMLHWEGDVPIPKLADFGLAKLLDQMEDNQTKTGMIMGTLKYMAPEQVNATKSVDQRADIYSLGICLYTLATLDSPFTGSMQEMIVQILYDGIPDPRTKNPNLSDVLADVIIQSLAKSADQRFQTCAAFKSALGYAVESESQAGFGETLTAAPNDMLQPPPPRDYEPLPSGAISGADSGKTISDSLRSSFGRGRDKSTMIVGGGKSRLLWILFACLLIGAAASYFVAGSSLFSGSPDAGEVRIPPPRGCVENTSRPCYASAIGSVGAAATKGVGVCKEGLQFCKKAAWGACQSAVLPTSETCNDKDDNCDGKVDEAFPKKGKACHEQRGECRSTGSWRCDAKGGLECKITAGAAKGTTHFSLTFLPANTNFRLSERRKTMTVRGSHCLVMKTGRSRRISLRAKGFYNCRGWVRAKGATRQVRMKRRSRSSLEPRRDYCFR